MNKASGVIEALARNGKGFKIGEQWFSVFKAVDLNNAQKGDNVTFDYVSTEKGGTTFHNVKGKVEITSVAPKNETPAATAGGAGAGRADGTDGTRGYDGDGFRKRSMKFFPVPKTDVDRPIIRQNSLTQANSLLSTLAGLGVLPAGGEPGDYADLAIELARQFEAYSTGEADSVG